MQDDDQRSGRLLGRREMLRLLGLSGAALLAGRPVPAATAMEQETLIGHTNPPSCIARPELTEGPYFVDERLERSDLRSDPLDGSVKEGARLDLAIRVSRLDGRDCAALAGAQVDIWHCDALGVYSDVSDRGFGRTKGKKFLRGYQFTDADGLARFTTVYPGWYRGRAVHIHFKIRTPKLNRHYDFTSQFFFDEALSQRIYTQTPYAGKGAGGMLGNERDSIYRESGGRTVLKVTERAGVYSAPFEIGLQLS
jgi:protocatechuate 3,4-dioxygenase beta subunit